jgi:hypothetical protein
LNLSIQQVKELERISALFKDRRLVLGSIGTQGKTAGCHIVKIATAKVALD